MYTHESVINPSMSIKEHIKEKLMFEMGLGLGWLYSL